MGNSDHASIDAKKLAESLRTKINNLDPLSECSIYRVPETHRCLNPSHYTPKMVSIGPFHHGNKELQAMEEHKTRYLWHFLQRTEVPMEDFLELIKKSETNLRNCYRETIPLGSDDFTTIILVDTVFLIELCLRGFKESFTTEYDYITRKPWLFYRFRLDLWLVENQLPLFILNDLFNLAKTATFGDCYEGLSLLKISDWLMKDIIMYVPVDHSLLEKHFSEAKHFLDWLRLCLQPSQLSSEFEFDMENKPFAKELHRAGVEIIKSKSGKTLFDVTFNKGILEVPFFRVYARMLGRSFSFTIY